MVRGAAANMVKILNGSSKFLSFSDAPKETVISRGY